MFKRILVPLDGSELAEGALPVATTIARLTRADIDLLLVHERSLSRTASEETESWRAEDRYLDAVGRRLAEEAEVRVTSETMSGGPSDAICGRADLVHADLIVMTSHGRTGFNRLWLGSVTDAVVRHARIPVVMVRSDPALAHAAVMRRILVPLDGSAWAAEVLPPAASLARAFGATLVLLRIVQPVPLGPGAVSDDSARDAAATGVLVEVARRELEAAAEPLRREGVKVEAEVDVAAHPAPAILEWSRGCELVALTTHGSGASRLVLGNIADKMIRATDSSMLILRPRAARVAPPLLEAREIEQQLPAMAGA